MQIKVIRSLGKTTVPHLHPARFASHLYQEPDPLNISSLWPVKRFVMKILSCYLLVVLLLSLLFGCAYFRKENPLNIKCPSCGYIWERTPAEH
jgi:hypothetical protein